MIVGILESTRVWYGWPPQPCRAPCCTVRPRRTVRDRVGCRSCVQRRAESGCIGIAHLSRVLYLIFVIRPGAAAGAGGSTHAVRAVFYSHATRIALLRYGYRI